MVFSTYKKLRIDFFHRKGLKAPEIGKRLFEEGMMTSKIRNSQIYKALWSNEFN